MSFKNKRRCDLMIYFSDSPSPVEVEGVCHIGTEGGLLRIVTDGGHDSGGQTQWWPLMHVFNIRLIRRYEVDAPSAPASTACLRRP